MVTGRYKLLGEIGRGGYGEVFLAEDMLLDRRVALKKLGNFGNMFTALKEIAVLACLPPHPNICPYQATATVNGSPVIITPYAPGGSLASCINDVADNPVRIIELALQSAFGLSQVHAFGLIHGDVKPQNLLIFGGWRLAIADFGLATHYSQGQRGRVGGTDAYLPPESDLFAAPDIGSDWYAWGLTFIEASIGRRPWRRGADAFESLKEYGVLDDSTVGGIPRRLAKILTSPPSAREEVAMEIISELGAVYSETTGSPHPVPPLVTERPSEVSTYIPGFQRSDLGGRVHGPEVLLLRSIDAADKAGLNADSLLAIHDEPVPATNLTAYLAGAIVTLGRIADALAVAADQRLEPLMGDAWSEMGLAYSYLGDPVGSVWAQMQAFEIFGALALKLNDDGLSEKTAGMSMRLSQSLSAIGEYQKAIAALYKGLSYARTLDTEIALRTELAHEQQNRGNIPTAVKEYSNLIARVDPELHAPFLAQLYHGRGGCLVRLGKPQEAEKDFRKSLEFLLPSSGRPSGVIVRMGNRWGINAQLPATLRLLGTSLTDSGKHAEAVEVYRQAVKSYEDFVGDFMTKEESEENIASTELSMSFSLEQLGDESASKAMLENSIARRRKLLEVGYDRAGTGLANSLVALTHWHIARGEHLEARISAAECLRITHTLGGMASTYEVHDIAFRCLTLMFNMDHNMSAEDLKSTISWALAELDAIDNISGSPESDRASHMQRASLLHNLAINIEDPLRELEILDAALKLAVSSERPDGPIDPLASQILIKSAITRRGQRDYGGAAKDSAKAIDISISSLRFRKEIGRVTAAAHELLMVNSLMLIAIILQETRGAIRVGGLTSEADAAAAALSVLRAIDPDDLPGFKCREAAETLIFAANFLPTDMRRDAPDAMLAFRLSVRGLTENPSNGQLEAVSRFSRLAATCLVTDNNANGVRSMLKIVQSLSKDVQFPNTMHQTALAVLTELGEYLENLIPQR